MTLKRLGLIVNPIAGIGGRVGLKGSDGADIQRQARALGAVARAGARTVEALHALTPLRDDLHIVAAPGEMGADAARACGFDPLVVGSITPGATTAEDTRAAAQDMRAHGIDLLLFAGGDGTARDIAAAVGAAVPALGIPAGVKIHSAVYAISPEAAGSLAASFLRGEVTALREAEVLDLDEDAYRRGEVAPRLCGVLRVPVERRLVQARKSPSPAAESAQLDAIAQDVIDSMQDGVLYVVGPGTTTRPILTRLGLPKTLIGVDALLDRQLAAADASEADLLRLLGERPVRIVVTPIGGQGYLFGRGNQPISPAVIRAAGRDGLIVVATVGKMLRWRAARCWSIPATPRSTAPWRATCRSSPATASGWCTTWGCRDRRGSADVRAGNGLQIADLQADCIQQVDQIGSPNAQLFRHVPLRNLAPHVLLMKGSQQRSEAFTNNLNGHVVLVPARMRGPRFDQPGDGVVILYRDLDHSGNPLNLYLVCSTNGAE